MEQQRPMWPAGDCGRKEETEEHILQRFTSEYNALAFFKYFELSYNEWRVGFPLLYAVAQPTPWPMQDAERGTALLHDELGSRDVGEFALMFDLKDLVLPSASVLMHLVRWMKQYACEFQWQLVAAAIVIRQGVFGQMARAGVTALTTAVPTTAKFKICFDEKSAGEWLDEVLRRHESQKAKCAVGPLCEGNDHESQRRSKWWRVLRNCGLLGCTCAALSFFVAEDVAAATGTCAALVPALCHAWSQRSKQRRIAKPGESSAPPSCRLPVDPLKAPPTCVGSVPERQVEPQSAAECLRSAFCCVESRPKD